MDLFQSESQSSDSAPSKDDRPPESRRRARKVKIRRTAELVPSHIPNDVEESRCSTKAKQQKLSFLPKIDLINEAPASARTLQNRKKESDMQQRSTFKVRRSILKGKRFPSAKKINKPPVASNSNRSIKKKLQLPCSSSVSSNKRNIPTENKKNSPLFILKDIYVNVTPLEKTNLLNESQKRQLEFPINRVNRIGSNLKKQLYTEKENMCSLRNTSLRTTVSPLNHTKRVQSESFSEFIQPCIVLLEKIPQVQMNMLMARAANSLVEDNSLDTSRNGKVNTELSVSSTSLSNLSKSDTDSFCANFAPLSQTTSSNNSIRSSTGRSSKSKKGAAEYRSPLPFSPTSSSSPMMSDNQKCSRSNSLSHDSLLDLHAKPHADANLNDNEKSYNLEISRDLCEWDISTIPSSSPVTTDTSSTSTPRLKTAVEGNAAPPKGLDVTFDFEWRNISPVLVDPQNRSKKRHTYHSLSQPPTKKRKIVNFNAAKRLSLQPVLLLQRKNFGPLIQKHPESLSTFEGSLNNSAINYLNKEELNDEVEEGSVIVSNTMLKNQKEERRATFNTKSTSLPRHTYHGLTSHSLAKNSCGATKEELSLQSASTTKKKSLTDEEQPEFLSTFQESLNDSKRNHFDKEELNCEPEESAIDFSNITLRKREESQVTFNTMSQSIIDIDSTSPPWNSDSGDCIMVNETFSKDEDLSRNNREQAESAYKSKQSFESSVQDLSDIVKTPPQKVRLGNITIDDPDSSSDIRTPISALKKKTNGKLSKNRKVTFSDLSVVIIDDSSVEQTPVSTLVPTNFSEGNQDYRSNSVQYLSPIRTSPRRSFRFDITGSYLTTYSTPKRKVDNTADQNQESCVTPKRTGLTPISIRESGSMPNTVKTPGPGRTPIYLRVAKLLEAQKSSQLSRTSTPLQPKSLSHENQIFHISKASNSGERRTPSLPVASKLHTFKRTKIPDFAKIHKKMLKMDEYSKQKSQETKFLHTDQTESAKKRSSFVNNLKAVPFQNSHAKIIPKPKPNSTKINSLEKAGYNRFGFKVAKCNAVPRKEEMKAAVNKVRPPKATTAENRTELKGVRSNRRFELLMRLRQVK